MKRRRTAAPYAKVLCALAKEGNQTELDGRELGDRARRPRARQVQDVCRPGVGKSKNKGGEHMSLIGLILTLVVVGIWVLQAVGLRGSLQNIRIR